MWPKLLAQLFELLPHVSRLVPMADAFFAGKAAEKASDAAAAAYAENMHGDLEQVAKAHETLYRRLVEMGAQVETLDDDVKRTRLVVEQHGHRLEALEEKVDSIGVWVKVGVVLLVVVAGLVIYLLVRGR
jgi:hypothetical protein